MNLIEMRQLPITELRAEITKTRDAIWKMRFKARGEPLESPGLLRSQRKDIARLLTILREKEMQAAASGGAAGKRKETPVGVAASAAAAPSVPV